MTKKKTDGFSILMFGITIAFYLFFALYDRAVICVDSPSYISMDASREPLYPMFLAMVRGTFAFWPEVYLDVVAFLQCMLAAFATYSLAAYLRREFSLGKLVSLAVLLMPLAVSLLCRFIAKRGSMYSNSILTEGIAISFYLLLFRYLLEHLFKHTKSSLILSAVISFLLISTRKQMMISLLLLIVVIVTVGITDKTNQELAQEAHRKSIVKSAMKSILMAIATSICILGASTCLDLGYNYALRGEAGTHTSDVRFASTIAFYTADRADAERLADEGIRNLFLEIYDSCEENGYLKNSAENGWSNRVSHFGDYYDCIQIDTMWPAVIRYVQDTYSNDLEGQNQADALQINQRADEIMQDFNMAVLPYHIGRVLEVFLDNFRSGLVTTVAQRNRLLNYYSVIVYLVYFVLLFVSIKKGKTNEDFRKVSGVTLLILAGIVFNTGLCSLVIFCQTRYTIYNMALFYIGLILMLNANAKAWRLRR